MKIYCCSHLFLHLIIFQAWLNNEISYIEVGNSYSYEANATQGTNITLTWDFDDGFSVTNYFDREFTSATAMHTFNTHGRYAVNISGSNLVSTDNKVLVIHALYSLDGIVFEVDSELANTTLAARFYFNLTLACNFPMGNVAFFIDFGHGSPMNFVEGLNDTALQLPHAIEKQHLFATQGVYEVNATAENILGRREYSLTVRVWDTLDPLNLEIQNHGNNIFVTNTTMTLAFENVPNAGFEYSITYGDGDEVRSNGSDILYHLYNLTVFEHNYSQPEVYTIVWTAENGHYSRLETFVSIVQNEIEEFQVY